MPDLSENLAGVDRVIHEPARLVLMTALSTCQFSDFLFLQRLTGLTAGNLSSHLIKLEEAGFLWMEKEIVGKRVRTRVGLTDTGRRAIEEHWRKLEVLRSQASVSDKQNSTT